MMTSRVVIVDRYRNGERMNTENEAYLRDRIGRIACGAIVPEERSDHSAVSTELRMRTDVPPLDSWE